MSEQMNRRRALMAALKAEFWSPRQAKAVADAVVNNAESDSWIRGKRALKRIAAAIRAALGGDEDLARRVLNVARRVAAGPAPENTGGISLKRPGQKPITLWRSPPSFPPEVPGQPLVRYEGFLYPHLAGLEGRVYGDSQGWRSVQWRYPGGAERPWERRDPWAFPPNSEALVPIQEWSRAFRRPGEHAHGGGEPDRIVGALDQVRDQLHRARVARVLTVAQVWDLRANIEEGAQHHSLTDRQLQAYARDLTHIQKVSARQLIAGDRVFNPVYHRWREAESVSEADGIVRVAYTDRYSEGFVPNTKVVRVPKSAEGSSALHVLVKPNP